MWQEPPAEAIAPPLSMPADLSETKPPQQIHYKKQQAPPLPPPSDDNDDDGGLSETEPSMTMMLPQRQEPPPKGLAPPCSQMKMYSACFATTGYDHYRSLWIGDLRPSMDKDYIINFCRDLGKEVLATVINNEQTQLPEFGFIEFTSTSEADEFIDLGKLNGWSLNLNVKWVTHLCRLRTPDGCYIYYDSPESGTRTYLPDFYRTLLSILFVRVDSFQSNSCPAKVTGTVTVRCKGGMFPLKVYDRTEDDGEVIVLSGVHLSLSGPSESVHVVDGFTIEVMLQVNGGEIARGTIDWGSLDSLTLNQLLDENVPGDYGSVTVSYSVVTHALNAVVEVLLIIGDGGESLEADVYGRIEVEQRDQNRITMIGLFGKLKDECVLVRSNRPFPLTRSVVVMPYHGFSIVVELRDRGTV